MSVTLAAAAVARGYRVEVFESIGSTNDEAMLRARGRDRGNLWILAQAQTAGRGRLARTWASPRGNLYTSVLLVDPAPVEMAPQLGFVAGVALADAVNSLSSGHKALLKWPNDLLIDSCKLAGLLIEATTLEDGRFVCAIGFGVNCKSHPLDTVYPATSLGQYFENADPLAIFGRLSEVFPVWLDVWARGQGFHRIRAEWLKRALPAGTGLRVTSGHRIRAGEFSTIDEQGRLVLDCADGVMTIDAGDVFPVAGAEHNQSVSPGAIYNV